MLWNLLNTIVFCFTGKIACANVLSDLYAMGVTECDNMLMLLGVSTKMTEKERDVVVPLMLRGFRVSKNANVFRISNSLCRKFQNNGKFS